MASFVLNVKLGVGAIFNTWVLTLPACGLWLFAWYDGWNNSFTKGYEQAGVGPGTELLGVGLFIAAMLYVPMAQGASGRHRPVALVLRFSVGLGVDSPTLVGVCQVGACFTVSCRYQ